MLKRFAVLVCLLSVGVANAFDTKAKQAILLDYSTGKILFEKNASQKMAPSSMSKLMTVYLAFEQIKQGHLKLQDKLMVSEKAWKKGGSKMFVKPNEMVEVNDLLRGIIVQSGNDASIVVAEGIAGSEEDFVVRMNNKAAELGMKSSHFANATGWPDPQHYMTASDLAILSRRLIEDFPEFFHYFAEPEFQFNGIKQPNRNLLINKSVGVDGLKTGHTDVGGYGIAACAMRDGRRLIAVVNGLKNENERMVESQALLQYGFLNFANVSVAKKGHGVIEIPVISGNSDSVKLATKEDVIFTVPVDQKNKISTVVKFPSLVYAPISDNIIVGKLVTKLADGASLETNLYAVKSVEERGFFGKMIEKVKFFSKNFSLNLPEATEKEQELKAN